MGVIAAAAAADSGLQPAGEQSIFEILHLVMLIFTYMEFYGCHALGIHTWRILTFSTISLLGGDHCLQPSRGFLDGILMIA